MSRRFIYSLLLGALVAFFPLPTPAPLVYTPGEGMAYEPVGSSGSWRRLRAEEQLQVTQEAFDSKDYSMALRSGKYLLKKWPLADYAPAAQFLVARSYELDGSDERAFDEYQKIFDKYPKSDQIEAALKHQFAIATRFLDGQRFRIFWKTIPFLPDMDKTAKLYERIVRNGPYGDVAAQAQLRIGAAFEKNKDYPEAVAAYERAADRYNDRPIVAADAVYRAGLCYTKQAATAEYDQGTAGQAIATFNDFLTLFPNDKRIPQAKRIIAALKNEQARGNFKIAEFYARQKKWDGAKVYYNEVVLRGPESPLAPLARQRIDQINSLTPPASP